MNVNIAEYYQSVASMAAQLMREDTKLPRADAIDTAFGIVEAPDHHSVASSAPSNRECEWVSRLMEANA